MKPESFDLIRNPFFYVKYENGGIDIVNAQNYKIAKIITGNLTFINSGMSMMHNDILLDHYECKQ
jgi:hypothetical protein